MLNVAALSTERQFGLLARLRHDGSLESAEQWQHGIVFVRRLHNGMYVVHANALTLLLSAPCEHEELRVYLLTCHAQCPACANASYVLPSDHPHFPRVERRSDGRWHVAVSCPAMGDTGELENVDVPMGGAL